MTSNNTIALCFRGFDLDPMSVESLVGFKASDLGIRGEPVKQGVKTLLKRSFVRYTMDFNTNSNLDEVIDIFFASLGGVEHLTNIRDTIESEFVDLGFVLKVKASEEQDSVFLTKETLESLFRLRVILSFQFV